jgi:hypothetical protein
MIVYILSDLGIPFYVGKGSSKDRAYSHEQYALSNNKSDLGYGLEKDYNPRKTRKIRKLLRENRSIGYNIIDCDSESAAYDLEIELIKKYGRRGIDKDGILTNIHPGGTGGDIWSTLSETRKLEILEKRRETLNNLPYEIKEDRSKNRSILTRQMMDNMTEEQRKERSSKISKSRAGIKMGPSPKKGKPATGNNSKGVRVAWNKDIDKNSKLAIHHRQKCQEYQQKSNPEEQGRTPYILMSPTGEIVEGKNPRLLIEKYNLGQRVMDLISGKSKKYKGWTRYEN